MDSLVTRINELARKHKTVGLSEAEAAERERLRRQYLTRFRSAFRQQLDSIEFTDEPPKPHLKQ
jgi:uncharacterized protein YnzC (UPF0291/DUF896 family)